MQDGGHLITCVRCPRLPRLDRLDRGRPRPLDIEVGRALGQRMHSKDDIRDDTEVAATTAAKGPEQVGIAVVVNGAELSVCGHHSHSKEAVQGQTEIPAGKAKAAAERDTRNSYRRARAGGKGCAVASECRGNIDQLATGADRRRAVALVDLD